MCPTVSVTDVSIYCEINCANPDATISQESHRRMPFVGDSVSPESVVREGGSDAAWNAGPLHEL
jgi:hypothetical protein